MKKSLNIQINFTNRAIYTLIAFGIFIIAGVAVFAFGTSSPSTFGHSAKELDLSGGVDGDAVFNGNVNVSGNGNFNSSVKLGSSTSSCNSGNEGALKYNPSLKCMEVCNSTAWQKIGC